MSTATRSAAPLHPVEIPTMAHERVVMCRDETTQLHALIAVHSTVLGPALGGTRFKAYTREPEALKDVLRLSEGMTVKAAVAGLPLGGGKAVHVGDPVRLNSTDLLAAYGRFVDDLGGTYVTAADVGATACDLVVEQALQDHTTIGEAAHALVRARLGSAWRNS